MQVNPAALVTAAATAPPGGAVTVPVVAGNLANVPLGALLQAVVTQVTPREAVLTVNGEALTVRAPAGLQAGAVLLVRVPAGAPGTLEITDAPPARAPKAPTPPATPLPARVELVDVLEARPDGRVSVRIDGQEQIATSAESLTPGARVLLEVAPTPGGVILRPPPQTAALPTEVATAIIRALPTPDFAATLQPLHDELATLTRVQSQEGETPVAPAVRDAAIAVRDALRALVPDEPRPLAAPELQRLIESGGLHYEAKLSRQAEAAPSFLGTLPANELKGDLKGDLLRLLQTAGELGATSAVPAAQAALDGIEARQAAQVLAQEAAAPYLLQVPFPDAGGWRTLHLSVEREVPPHTPDAEREGRFRLLMHVPLTELGDTWIDAGLSGASFRAAIYLDRADVRERVNAALPELRAELQADGFDEVLLDVRPTSALPASAKQQSAALLAGRPAGTSLLDVKV